MSAATTDMRSLITEIAGPQPLGPGNVKRALMRVAELTGLNERRVRAFWNGEARRVDGNEIELLRAAARLAGAQRSAESRKTNDARIRMAADFEALAERLAATDPAFFGGDIARLRNDAARLRSLAAE